MPPGCSPVSVAFNSAPARGREGATGLILLADLVVRAASDRFVSGTAMGRRVSGSGLAALS